MDEEEALGWIDASLGSNDGWYLDHLEILKEAMKVLNNYVNTSGQKISLARSCYEKARRAYRCEQRMNGNIPSAQIDALVQQDLIQYDTAMQGVEK